MPTDKSHDPMDDFTRAALAAEIRDHADTTGGLQDAITAAAERGFPEHTSQLERLGLTKAVIVGGLSLIPETTLGVIVGQLHSLGASRAEIGDLMQAAYHNTQDLTARIEPFCQSADGRSDVIARALTYVMVEYLRLSTPHADVGAILTFIANTVLDLIGLVGLPSTS